MCLLFFIVFVIFIVKINVQKICWIIIFRNNLYYFSLFLFNKKTGGKKRIRKNLHDFLWFGLKKRIVNFNSFLTSIDETNVYKMHWFARYEYLIALPQTPRIVIFNAYIISIVEINVHQTPNVLIFTMTIIFCLNLACIVNFNAFFISIVEINVYQSNDFHDNNNWLFFMLQVLYWFSVSLNR